MTVQIGALSTVPAPGDPIRSPWAQAVSGFAYHIFASKAALDAQWSTAPIGSHAYTTNERRHWVRESGYWAHAGPGGQLAYGERTTATGVIAPSADTLVGGWETTFTVSANRRVQVTAYCPAINGTSGSVVDVKCKDGSTAIMHGRASIPPTNIASAITLTRTLTPAPGAHAYLMTVACTPAGVVVTANTEGPCSIAVVDVGPV